MSIYLSESHRMLKADSQRPGRYFGWISHGHAGLLYLTYFTNGFVNSSSSYDSPVVRDNSIPLIQGQTSQYNPDVTYPDIIGSTHPGLPDSFNGLNCQNVKFKTTNENKSPCDTFNLPWDLPFESSDVWSMTFRAYYPTNQYISVQYSEEDIDTYALNPSVGLECGTPNTNDSNLFGTGNFDTSLYPKKVLCTYKQSTEENPNVWPTDFPNVTEYNGTSYDTFKDASYDHGGAWPPGGRLFHSISNSAITDINGDQWFYTVIVGHGDGTVSIYVNGLRILNVPFQNVWYLVLYVGAKRFSGAEYIYTSNLQYMKVTEVSLWGKDLSILNRSQVRVPTQPIYKKVNGVYVPNEAY